MNYSGDSDDLLEQARYDIFRHLLPVIVCMFIFGATGVVGNGLTIIFYAFKTKRATTVVLIACLAVIDLTVCVLFIPNIVEMWVNVRYTQSFICKLAHFIGLWAVACSCLTLWVVAIDRHRKICHPFGKQMTLKTVKYAVVGIVVFGFFLAVRNFANFDTVEVDVTVPGINETVRGRYCTTRDDSSYTASITVFTAIDFLILLMVWITLAIAYSHIICTLFRLKRVRNEIQKKPQVGELEVSIGTYENDVSDTKKHSHEGKSLGMKEHSTEGCKKSGSPADKHVTINDQSQTITIVENELIFEPSSETKKFWNDKHRSEKNDSLVVLRQTEREGRDKSELHTESPASVTLSSLSICDTQTSGDYSGDFLSSHASDSRARDPSQERTPRRKKHRQRNTAKSARERNLTFKMLTVSIVFILCFTPYFVVKILMREVLKSGEEYELSLLSQIALRLPYTNSVFNPVVYCVFNPQFRLFVKDMIFGFCSKCFGKTKCLFKS